MHKALDRPANPGQPKSNGYNPLQRSEPRSGMLWWIITGLALFIALVLLAWPQWRPAAEPPIPAMVQAPSAAENLSSPVTASTDAGTAVPAKLEPEPKPKPKPETIETVAVNRVQKMSQPETVASSDSLTPTTIEPETKATPGASPEQPAAAEANAQARKPDTEQALAAMPKPVSEPSPTASTEAFPAAADSSDNEPETPMVTSRPTPASSTDTRSGSSVANAVPQHDAMRQAVQSAIGRGDLKQAQQLLLSWINQDPALEEPRIWLAKVYLNRGARQEAETLLVGLQSNEALGLRGLVLEQTGRYADAARIFEALARKEAGNPQWWLHWAINLENNGRLAEARLLYQTYLEQFSNHNARLTAFATERYRALAG